MPFPLYNYQPNKRAPLSQYGYWATQSGESMEQLDGLGFRGEGVLGFLLLNLYLLLLKGFMVRGLLSVLRWSSCMFKADLI